MYQQIIDDQLFLSILVFNPACQKRRAKSDNRITATVDCYCCGTVLCCHYHRSPANPRHINIIFDIDGNIILNTIIRNKLHSGNKFIGSRYCNNFISVSVNYFLIAINDNEQTGCSEVLKTVYKSAGICNVTGFNNTVINTIYNIRIAKIGNTYNRTDTFVFVRIGRNECSINYVTIFDILICSGIGSGSAEYSSNGSNASDLTIFNSTVRYIDSSFNYAVFSCCISY